jgi:hypothetical protein
MISLKIYDEIVSGKLFVSLHTVGLLCSMYDKIF